MGIVNREKASKAFEEYISHYDITDGKIKLKVDHTFRVNALCEKIAKNLGLSEEDIDLAWLIGLLHDIGRFEQVKDYGTFNDAMSVDHAKYGVKLLFEKGKIKDFIDNREFDSIIQTAIDLHNTFRLPTEMDEKTKLFCKIIRDADKIDILRVNVDTPIEVIYNISTEELRKQSVSDEVFEQFFQKTAIQHKYKKTAVDRYFGHISLVFELEFPISYAIVKEQGYLDKILAYRNDLPETNERFQEAGDFIHAYIEEQLTK